MATTIVRHCENKGLFAVLGAGHGTWKTTSREGLIDIFYVEGDGSETVLVVCDRKGTIGSFPVKDLEVVSVDGISPRDAIARALEDFGEGTEKSE